MLSTNTSPKFCSPISNAVTVEFASAIIASNSNDSAEIIQTVLNVKDRERRFARVCLIASPHGSPALLAHVREIITSVWLRAFNLEEHDLIDGARAAITFVFGGITATWASSHGFDRTLASILGTDLVAYNIQALRKELRKAAEEKERKESKE